MNRKAALIVSGLLFCCLSQPVSVLAEAYAEAGNPPAVSAEIAGKKKKRFKKKHQAEIDALVKDHVISKETGAKVKAYLKQHAEERKAEREKVKNMTNDERRAYFHEKYPNGKPDIWAEMAAEGVITPAEAEAIKAALRAKHENTKLRD